MLTMDVKQQQFSACTYCVSHFRIKSESKGNDEQHVDNKKFQERRENVFKHHDVDSNSGKLLDVKRQVDPAKEHRGCTNRPLPFLQIRHHVRLKVNSSAPDKKG